jgi:serine/threonine protein kinase, bacterial
LIKNGTMIGTRYRVISYIASGGMQDVYKAHDELTSIDVALKTPQPGQGGVRFHNSARLSAQINHYNVAKTYDYFELEGQCYLIEELVEGATLEAATLAMMPQIDPHLASYLFLRLAKGLAASHMAGVAHRDLKPSNVLVDTGLSQVKITDFGIATITEKLFDEVIAKGDLTRSTSGTIKGALPFMAPEMMFRQKGDIVGPEADIWSLGAMMFRLMTGNYPFGEAMMVPVNVKNNTRAPWPSFLSNNAQFAPLSDSLKNAVEACLEYDKAKRISAADLVARCEDLCFFYSDRRCGIVEEVIGSRGFIRLDTGGKIFYHSKSVYGRHSAKKGDKVVFSAHAGQPFPRAHPVIVCLP